MSNFVVIFNKILNKNRKSLLKHVKRTYCALKKS